MLIFVSCIDDAYKRYRKRNINDTQRKEGVPSHRISASELSLEDDVKEFCVEDSVEGKLCCSTIINMVAGIHHNLDTIKIMKCTYATVKSVMM